MTFSSTNAFECVSPQDYLTSVCVPKYFKQPVVHLHGEDRAAFLVNLEFVVVKKQKEKRVVWSGGRENEIGRRKLNIS